MLTRWSESTVDSSEVWDLVLNNERLLRRECLRYLPRNRKDEADEMYSDVVIARAHSIMATFIDGGVKPITHLCANVRWYAYKWSHGRCYKYVPPPVDVTLHDSGYVNNHESVAEVKLILSSLPEEAADLLRWHVMMGLTFDEIARHVGETKAQVKTRFREAVQMAKELGVYSRMSKWGEAVLDDSCYDQDTAVEA